MQFQTGDDVEVYLGDSSVGYAQIVLKLSPEEFVIRWYWTYDDLVNVAGFTEDELEDLEFNDSDIADTDTETTASVSTIIGKARLSAPRFFYDDTAQELTSLESEQEESTSEEEEEQLEEEKEELNRESEAEYEASESEALSGEESSENESESERSTSEEEEQQLEEEQLEEELEELKEPLAQRKRQVSPIIVSSSSESGNRGARKRTRQTGQAEVRRRACLARERPEGRIEEFSQYRQKLHDVKETEGCVLREYDPTTLIHFLRDPPLWKTAYAQRSGFEKLIKGTLLEFGNCGGKNNDSRRQIIHDYFFTGDYDEHRLNATVTMIPLKRRYVTQCEACGIPPRTLAFHFVELDWDVGPDCASKLELASKILTLIARMRYEVCIQPEVLDDDE